MNRRIAMSVAIIGAILLVTSMTNVRSSPKVSLNTTRHETTIPIQVSDIVITAPTRGFVWNFTVDLTGKDPGSDRFDLVVDASGSSSEGSVPLAAR